MFFPSPAAIQGGGASCHLLAKCCLRQLSLLSLGPELPFPGLGLGSSGALEKWVPSGFCLPHCLSCGWLGTGLVRKGGYPG